MTALHVFTRDLRTHDNPGLLAAAPDVVPVFVADPAAERLHGSRNRRAHLVETIRGLDGDLRALGAPLVYRSGPWLDTVLDIATEADADEIHIARDVSGFAQRRLAALEERSPVPVVVHDSITVVPPDALAPSTGDFYQVFTPYHRKWLAEEWRPLAGEPEELAGHDIASDDLPDPVDGGSPERIAGGETAARLDMDRWIPRSRRYGTIRNDLAADATSKLSAALHFGTLSALEVALRADEAGGEAFVRQIAWRDFYAQVLYHRPESSHDDYRGAGDLAWNDDPEALEAWKQGQTGYPIVDAGMRQLRETGWMHNRTRMIVASFLTKDLMIDWRLGARHFLDWLTDGDVANNQMGWQWVAGTGTDTNPTRIFNPTLQSERYDPSGEYIRRWVPELSDIDDEEIHDPAPLTRAGTGYPLPIVDHHEAIRDFKEARGFG